MKKKATFFQNFIFSHFFFQQENSRKNSFHQKRKSFQEFFLQIFQKDFYRKIGIKLELLRRETKNFLKNFQVFLTLPKNDHFNVKRKTPVIFLFK